jgi:hypothetical protein
LFFRSGFDLDLVKRNTSFYTKIKCTDREWDHDIIFVVRLFYPYDGFAANGPVNKPFGRIYPKPDNKIDLAIAKFLVKHRHLILSR